jgi:putative two-component system response regulator
VGIPDDVLLKPGKLTPEEFELMKTHTVLGHDALLRTGSKIKDNAFLKYADDVAYTHQEKFDGSGYPRGLKGKEIPLIGRLMAVADVYDALISKRVYKEAYSHEKAVNIIKASKGSHFDPVLVDAFLEIENTFKNIAHTYQDTKSHQHYPDLLVKYAREGIIKDILLVDDSRIIRTILKNQLQRIGFLIDEAEDGKQGLKKIKEKHYDLILSDVEMPIMNGFEFTQKAVKYLGPEALIIIMTATAYDASEELLDSIGAKGLLFKPVDLTRLEDKLSKFLASKDGEL